MSLRDYFLLEYTDQLQSHPKHEAFWRVICDYLAAAGDEGRNRLKSYVVHIGLGLEQAKKGRKGDTVQGDIEVEGVDGAVQEGAESGIESQLKHFTEVSEACVELRLEEEWKVISRIMADRLVRTGNYGMASIMCLQAEDGYALSRIAEKILDCYIESGKSSGCHLAV
jgi:nuclear pore complex protein Nup85